MMQLTLRDLALAVAVVAVWGTNFVVIRLGLDQLPPLLFASLRFLFALLPAVFFVKRPPVPWATWRPTACWVASVSSACSISP